MNRCSLALVLALVATAAPGAAVAQPGAPAKTASDPDAVKRAEALYNQGVRLYSDKKWKEAEAAFRAAWALSPTFDVAYNLGSTLYQLGDHRGAAEHLALALRRWPLIGATSSLRPVAQQRLDEARRFVGTLAVKVNVAQAEVLIDGKPIGISPLEGDVFVEPGVHTLEARLEGYEAAKQEVHAGKGGSHAVELTLVPRAPSPPTGSAVAPTQRSSTMGNIGAGQATSPARVEESSGQQRSLVPAIVLGGVAVVGLAGGIGFTVASNAQRSESRELQAEIDAGGSLCGAGADATACQELRDALSATDTFRSFAVASFVIAGVGAIGAATYLLWPTPKPASGGVIRAAPLVSAQGAGMLLVGSF